MSDILVVGIVGFFFGCFAIPILLYASIKVGTVAYLRGKQFYEERKRTNDHKDEEKT